jgi:hypothetical protein
MCAPRLAPGLETAIILSLEIWTAALAETHSDAVGEDDRMLLSCVRLEMSGG